MGTSFKDQIKADISSVFLNGLEFADDHELNGKTMKAVIDDNELLERDNNISKDFVENSLQQIKDIVNTIHNFACELQAKNA